MKLTKILFCTGVAIPSLIVPMSTLTSCGQSWGNKTPFMIGSMDYGPYVGFEHNKFHDKNGNDIIDYIQHQYAVQTKTGQFYSYSTPFEFDDKGEETGEWKQIGEPGWYQSGNESFVMSASDKKPDETVDSMCAGNAALSSNIDFISTIGSSINNFISYALQYQSQQVKADSETNLQIAWGGGDKVGDKKFILNHGKKDGTDAEKLQNNDFYEHIFASANLNGKEKSEAMLKTSGVNFEFNEFPLPSYDETRKILDYTGELICGTTWHSTEFSAFATGDPQEVEEKEGEITYKYNIYTYDAVPVVINFKDITQTYLNPSNKDDSFLVNDYYSTISQINSSIGDQWKQMMPELTSRAKDDCIPHNRSFTLSALSPSECKKIDLTNFKHDTRLVPSDENQIHANTFIALIGYKLKITLDSPEMRDKNAVTITGLQNIFPSYFIDLYGEELFKLNKQTESGPYYVFNQDKINEVTTKLLNLLRRTGKEGYETDLTKLDEESQKLLTFLGYMFGSNTNTIKTNDFMEPIEPINS